MAAVRSRRRVRRWLTSLLALLLVVALAVGWWWWTYRSPFTQRTEVVTTGYVATYVSDGDTIVVADASGIEHSVRLVGINAPEVVHGADPGECFGTESRELARSLLPRGTPVALVADPGLPAADQYGRRLAYVEVNGVDVGRTLLDRGAVVVYELKSQAIPTRSTPYRQAERSATAAKAGLWGACPAPPTRRS